MTRKNSDLSVRKKTKNPGANAAVTLWERCRNVLSVSYNYIAITSETDMVTTLILDLLQRFDNVNHDTVTHNFAASPGQLIQM